MLQMPPKIIENPVLNWVWVNTYRYLFLVGWTSINPSYDLGWTKRTRVLTHPQLLNMFLAIFGHEFWPLVLKMRQLLASAACEPWSFACWSQLGCFLSPLRPESDMLGQRMPGQRQPTRQLRWLGNDSIRATGKGLKKGGLVSFCPRCWVWHPASKQGPWKLEAKIALKEVVVA